MTDESSRALREDGALHVDRAGYMLGIDPRGRLQVTRLCLGFDSWQHAAATATTAATRHHVDA